VSAKAVQAILKVVKQKNVTIKENFKDILISGEKEDIYTFMSDK